MEGVNHNKPNSVGRVAVLMGGNSQQRAISLQTGSAIVASLKRSQVAVSAIDIQHFSTAIINQLQGFNRIFNALHGGFSEDGTLQGLLNCSGIAYSGSDVLGSALSSNKVKSKQIWQSFGLTTPDFWALDTTAFDYDYTFEAFFRTVSGDKARFPLVIKPLCEGSSIGIKKIDSLRKLAQALEEGFSKYPQLLVERFIQGQEYSVTLLNGRPLPVVKIKANTEIYDYDAKYNAQPELFEASGLSIDQEQNMQVLALKAWQSLSCKGLGTVDILMQENQLFLLEANSLPAITQASVVAKATELAGLDFDSCIVNMISSLACN